MTTTVLREQQQQQPVNEQQQQQEENDAKQQSVPLPNTAARRGGPDVANAEVEQIVQEQAAATCMPLTPLHEAAAQANVEALLALLSSSLQVSCAKPTPTTDHISNNGNNIDDESRETCQQHYSNGTVVDSVAGDLLQTALHYAAAAVAVAAGDGANSSSSNDQVPPAATATATATSSDSATATADSAAECVYHLLVTGHADPCVVDARNRPPYYLASHDKVRDAFRRARAVLGENYCDWNNGAKVGPPLTEDDIRLKKEKEAEKKRKKKARQKEKKVKEKMHAEAAEQQKREMELKIQQEEEAKRIRDGLQPKASTATNVCDFCQKVCKGKRRSQMFQRLDYAYCSTDCVQKHKRELMAAAAMARAGIC